MKTIHKTQKNTIKMFDFEKRRNIKIRKLLRVPTKKESYKAEKKYISLPDFLVQKNFYEKVKLKKTRYKSFEMRHDLKKEMIIKIPKYFSFTQNSDETIKALKQIFSYYKRDCHPGITLDFKYCEKIDLDASTVLSSIILALDDFSEKNKNINSFLVNAKDINMNSDVYKILRISGLIEHLHFPKIKEDLDIEEEFLTMPMITSSCEKEPVEKIITYYTECLYLQGFTLNEAGDQLLGELIGEIFNNIGDHNKNFNSWYAIGHCEKQVRNECSEVQLSIFNYGVSFYESYSQNDTEEYSKKLMDYYYKKNIVEKKIKMSKELYYSLISLQGGISRLNEDKLSNRGQGTIDLIEAFEKLGQSSYEGVSSEMSITSGSVTFIFNPSGNISKYRRIFLNERFEIIKSNVEENVRINQSFFPGTVISMKFFVDKKYLEDILV